MNVKTTPVLLLVLLVSCTVLANPILNPDDADDADDADTSNSDDDGDKDPEDPVKALGDLIGGLFNLAQGVAEAVHHVAEDEHVQKTVGGLVEMGVNATSHLVKVGGELAKNAPEVIERSSQFVEGLVKTTNESTPVVQRNLNDLNRVGQIAGGFLRTYGETFMDSLENFFETFDRRMKCHTECSSISGNDAEKKRCERRFCDGFNQDKFRFEDLPEERMDKEEEEEEEEEEADEI